MYAYTINKSHDGTIDGPCIRKQIEIFNSNNISRLFRTIVAN